MKSVLSLLSVLLLSTIIFTGCGDPEPYQYPNYDIIKPETTCQPKRTNIQRLLLSSLGKPYVWAEEGPDAFDCSGLTYNIYGSMGMKIPRTASEQAKMGKHVAFQDLHYGVCIKE